MWTVFDGKRVNVRNIGILTGGGDCAGLNSVIAGFLRRVHGANKDLPTGEGGETIFVYGLYDGWKSLIRDPSEGCYPVFKLLELRDVEKSFSEPGTIIGSSRTNIFSKENVAKGMPEKAFAMMRKLRLDCLCVLGGDDTLGAARKLSEKFTFPVLGAPKTMDNDIFGTEKTFGFESAYMEASRIIANLMYTARSHHRIFVVEVMGRHAGWVALYAGVSAGAHVTLLPEETLDLEALCYKANKIKNIFGSGVIVVSEGVQIFGSDPEINFKNKSILDRAVANPKNTMLKARVESEKDHDAFGNPILSGAGEILIALLKEMAPEIEYRFQNCGHAIRAVAHPQDIILGLRFGNALFDCIMEGKFGVYPTLEGGRIIPKPLSEAKGGRFVTDGDYRDMILMKDLIDFY